jgi:hypothetical protein
MKRSLQIGVVGLIIAVLAATALPVRADSFSVTIHEGDRKGFIGVVDGKPVAVVKAPKDKNLENNDLWEVDWGGIELQHSGANVRLAYSIESNESTVRLVKNPSEATQWDEKTEQDGEIHICVLRAKNGPHKGWYLGYSDKPVDIGSGGEAYPLILSKKPDHIKSLQILGISK